MQAGFGIMLEEERGIKMSSGERQSKQLRFPGAVFD